MTRRAGNRLPDSRQPADSDLKTMTQRHEILSCIKALMLDIDGVLLVGNQMLPNAIKAVQKLVEIGLSLRFVTNTTKEPRATLLQRLQGYGFPIESTQLFTVAALARQKMTRKGPTTYRLIGPPELEVDLGPGRLDLEDPSTPDWVVMGLHKPSFTHEVLNVGFRDLSQGARLIALHVNRAWKTQRGMEMGLGAYVKALEYASQTQAIVMGKPSSAFFEEVLADLGIPRETIAMVGDDVESDVGGALALGLHGILVRTGKFSPRTLELSGIRPSVIVDDIWELAQRLEADRA